MITFALGICIARIPDQVAVRIPVSVYATHGAVHCVSVVVTPYLSIYISVAISISVSIAVWLSDTLSVITLSQVGRKDQVAIGLVNI